MKAALKTLQSDNISDICKIRRAKSGKFAPKPFKSDQRSLKSGPKSMKPDSKSIPYTRPGIPQNRAYTRSQ